MNLISAISICFLISHITELNCLKNCIVCTYVILAVKKPPFDIIKVTVALPMLSTSRLE